MAILSDRIAIVTGGTRGVGRGIARALANEGARVFVTGRSADDGARLDEHVIGIRCDHGVDKDVMAAFDRVRRGDRRDRPA